MLNSGEIVKLAKVVKKAITFTTATAMSLSALSVTAMAENSEEPFYFAASSRYDFSDGPYSNGDYEYYADESYNVAQITGYYGDDKDIVIPDQLDGYSIIYIGERAFQDNDFIESVVFDDNSEITRICEFAFYDCDNLKSISVFSKNRYGIYKGAFSSCDSLEEVNLGASLDYLDEFTFPYCPSLKIFNAPCINAWSSEFPKQIFYESNLDTFAIPSRTKIIAENAFQCANINTLYIPKSVNTISDYYWSDCPIINYEGTEEEWNEITFDYDYESQFSDVVINFNTPYIYSPYFTDEPYTSNGMVTFDWYSDRPYATFFPDFTSNVAYKVYRSDSRTGEKILLDTTTDQYYTDKTVEKGKTYYYFTEAYDTVTGYTSYMSMPRKIYVEPDKNRDVTTLNGSFEISADSYQYASPSVYRCINYRLATFGYDDGKTPLIENELKVDDHVYVEIYKDGVNVTDKFTICAVIPGKDGGDSYLPMGSSTIRECTENKSLVFSINLIVGETAKSSAYTYSEYRTIVASPKGETIPEEGTYTYKFIHAPYESNYKPADPSKINSFVNRLYKIILGRDAEPEGLADWTNRLVSGTATSAEIVYGIANSQEFANRGLSNEDIVETMYQAMLGRASDEGGKANWINCLNSGMTVTGIINGFSGSQEFANICAEYGIQAGAITTCEARDKNNGLTLFVSRMYTKALNRPYDVAGLNDWTNRYLTGTAKVSDIAFGFIFSPEFVGKNLSNSDYVDTLYRTFFNREPDEGGKADWMNKLASGTAREDVLNGFVGSQECINLVATFGI